MADLSSQDFASISASHGAIKQEISEIRSLAQPLLSNSHKSGSLWTAEKDNTVGPGSYDVTGDLGLRHTLSVYRGSPHAVFPRAGQSPPGSTSAFTPAPGTYSPSTSLIYRTDPKVSIAGNKFERLPYLEELKRRSPGPIYSVETGKMPGGHISASKRDTFRHFVRNNFPSPQTYTVDVKAKTMSGRFGKSGKSDYMKEYMPGMERLLKGREGEFTANMDSAPVTGNGLLKGSGHVGLVNSYIVSPGVGSYSTETLKSERCKFSFPKAVRRTDLKLK